MAKRVTGELYESIAEKLFEVGSQLRHPSGYPFDPEGLKNFLQLAIEGKFNGIEALAVKPQLLSLTRASALAYMRQFTARERFKVSTDDKAKLKITFVGENFEARFTSKVEKKILPGELKFQKLLVDATDVSIIETLGEGHETQLADLWRLLKQQGRGNQGPLLVGGYLNIFYIRDVEDNLGVVYVYWSSDIKNSGWIINTHPAEHPFGWTKGYQIISR